MRARWLLVALPLLVLPASWGSSEPPTPPVQTGIAVDPLPAPPRQLIVVPDPPPPPRTFGDVLNDVLRQQR